MYRFFVEESQIYDGTVHITGSDVNHIKNVLRMRPGEKYWSVPEAKRNIIVPFRISRKGRFLPQ